LAKSDLKIAANILFILNVFVTKLNVFWVSFQKNPIFIIKKHLIMKRLAFITILFAFNSYSQNGELDLTFATDGIFEVSDIKRANSIVTDNSENIFCIGVTQNSEAVVLKLTPNGQVDNSFGDNGRVLLNQQATGLKGIVDDNGKILCLTGSLTGGNHFILEIVRLNIDGSFDNSFGDNGVFLFENIDEISPISFINFEDGFLIYARTGWSEYKFIKILPNGTLDLSFGDGGVVSNDIGTGGDDGRDFLIDSENNIYVCGDSMAPSYWVRKYDSEGQVDATFGDNGILKTELYLDDWDDVDIYAMAIHDDIIYLSGEVEWLFSTSRLTAIVKLSTDGEPDNTWGENGMRTSAGYISGDANSYSFTAGKAIITHPTGKIIFGGPFASNVPGEERNILCTASPGGSLIMKFSFSFFASYKSFCFQNGDQLLGAGYTSSNGHLIVNRYNVGPLGTGDYSYGKV